MRRRRAARWITLPLAAGFLAVLATVDGATASNATASPASSAAPIGVTLQQRFAGQMLLGRRIVIGGLGSSVGAGATLPDPAGQAPVAVFAADLAARVDPSGSARWVVENDSVNGSTIHDGTARDWAVLAAKHPDVVVLAYGMNDGAPAQFESGETYAGSMYGLQQLIGWIRDSGAVPVLLTTPSPHTGRIDLASQVPGAVPQQSPVIVGDGVRTVEVAGAGTTEESTRHAAVNAGMRALAAAEGVDLIDVEPYWRRATATRGQDAVFLPGEFVHPDLLGHRLGYDQAIADALQGAFRDPLQRTLPVG